MNHKIVYTILLIFMMKELLYPIRFYLVGLLPTTIRIMSVTSFFKN
jgi:hypothetical protein